MTPISGESFNCDAGQHFISFADLIDCLDLGIKVDESLSRSFHAEGHDIQSLLFNFLDELLFIFHTEFFVACELEVGKRVPCSREAPARLLCAYRIAAK